MRRFLVLGVFAAGFGAFGFVMGQEKADSGLPVYLVAQIRIDDRETYRKYEVGFGEIFQKYAGESVAFTENPDIIEGEWPYSRTVLLRFPSKGEFHAWYDSDEYQELVKNRWASSEANIIVMRGRP